MDLEIREFRDALVAFINSYQIPVEVKRLVFLEVYGMLEKASEQFIIQQKVVKEQEEKKNE